MSKFVAIYNGFLFHYEVIGYILHYCLLQGHRVVVYCDLEGSNGYIELFQQLFQQQTDDRGQDGPEFRRIEKFDIEKCCYDAIFLLTDDDMSFSTSDPDINRNTIRIDHDFFVRRPEIEKCIATRPFFNGNSLPLMRPWALPCYPIIGMDSKSSILNSDNKTHVVIINNDYFYHSSIINRLQSDKMIVIHAISRDMDASRFSSLRPDIELKLYKNIDAIELLRIVVHSDYVLTDVSCNPEYENIKMSGAIPLAFSTLVPLIISKQTNSHYQFKNIIEFDKYGREPIMLGDVGSDFFHKLENERTELIETFFQIMRKYFE